MTAGDGSGWSCLAGIVAAALNSVAAPDTMRGHSPAETRRVTIVIVRARMRSGMVLGIELEVLDP
jgi:hypothetical protein